MGRSDTVAPRLLRAGARTGKTGVALWVLGVALLVYLAAGPLFLLDSFQRTLGGVFMFATLALAWDIIGGWTGYPSFGNVVFFGLGGYTVAVLMAKARWSFWPALPIAAAMGTAFAMLVGLPILRLRGHYFAIATLGVAEGTREVVLNWPSLTGGGAGITIPAVGAQATTSYPGNTGFYYLFLVLMLISLFVLWRVSRSKFGYALRAIHQDEDAAAAMGIDTTQSKIAAFALSGLLTACAGAIYAFQQVTIYPHRLFSVDITVLMVVMAVIGGSGTVIGPFLGAVGLQFLSEYLRESFLDWNLFIFGAIIVVAVVLLPQGAVSFTRDVWRSRRVALLDNIRRYRL